MHTYAVADTTGLVIRAGLAGTMELACLQAVEPNEKVYVDLDASLGDTIVAGQVRRAIPTQATITAEQVKNEQRRRLSYTDGYITRSADPGDGRPPPEWASLQRKAIREAARRIEALEPIPPDFRNEHYWS